MGSIEWAAWLAVAAGLASAWGRIVGWVEFVRSRVIVTVDIETHDLGCALRHYAKTHWTPSALGRRSFFGARIQFASTGRYHFVAAEDIGGSGRLFWHNWTPILIGKQSENTTSPPSIETGSFTLSVLRGTINIDRMLADACDEYTHFRSADNLARRHHIYHQSGTAGDNRQAIASMAIHATPQSSDPWIGRLIESRILRHSDSIVRPISHVNECMERLAIPRELQCAINDAKHWLDNEQWYRTRGVPWRTNWLLSGPPGTGKTSTVRAIAEQFDMPVFVYDVATFRNSELREQWRSMMTSAPCIALLEDLDSVFHGRKNVAGTELTIDCLLNCLDGVAKCDGLFVVITTNNPDKLDPAMLRPGRVDRHVVLGNLDYDGRRHIASRILQDVPDELDRIVREGDGDTGAAFQERCIREALKWRAETNG